MDVSWCRARAEGTPGGRVTSRGRRSSRADGCADEEARRVAGEVRGLFRRLGVGVALFCPLEDLELAAVDGG